MTKPTEIAEQLRSTLNTLVEATSIGTLTAPARRKLEDQIREAMTELAALLNRIDPVKQPTHVFDPGDPKIVGRFVAIALVAQSRQPLAQIADFYGSGIYAIYYKGAFPQYAPLSGTETPIYVGQAAPAIPNAATPLQQGERLAGRLKDHKRSVGGVSSTLSLDDFEYRALVVQTGYESAAEDYLIHLFKPIWNRETRIIQGFGKHGDSFETRAHPRSPWHTLHPGRGWADGQGTDAKSIEAISTELTAHFAAHPVFKDVDGVLASFFDELKQA